LAEQQPCTSRMCLEFSGWEHFSHISCVHLQCDQYGSGGKMLKHVQHLQSKYIPDVLAWCSLHVTQGDTVGTVKLGSKCTDWLLVWDNLGRNGKYIWNVISLWLVGTRRSHVKGTLQMSFTCVWWLHHRQSVPVLTMFLRCSHLFPGALAPSV